MRFASWAVLAALIATYVAPLSIPAAAQMGIQPRQRVVQRLTLPDGRRADVYANGVATVWSKDRKQIVYRHLVPAFDGPNVIGTVPALPPPAATIAQLERAPAQAYPQGQVLVVFRRGFDPDSLGVAKTLATLRVDRRDRLFAGVEPGMLPATLGDVFRLHFTGATVRAAIAQLAKLPGVAYVSPNWYVSPMHAASFPIPPAALADARRFAPASALQPVPANYAVAESAQSLLNAPGTDAMGAYDEIVRTFHEMPGAGEIVTNVSIGDLTDASILGGSGSRIAPNRGGGSGSSDPCSGVAQYYGPTTVLVSGSRYLDLPSMPLIPTYVADASGNLSASAEVCNTADGTLQEAGLDFSVMAPLPHDRQRPGAKGSGYTDLFGIAPGASYRLVVPGDPAATIADIDAALLGAAMQQPRPNVITASLGFGFDTQGFPDRYLEEDPLTNALVGSIVQHYGIAVCIAANDGLGTATNAAVAPSGGSAKTELAPNGGLASTLDDVAFSTAPSSVYDSGAIDAGGTTLDDIVSAQPQNPANAALAAQHAFAITRWNGMAAFSSGFGSRADLSAPADNILAMSHSVGGSAQTVDVNVIGGTSASAPETAAAAAVALQVARLTHHAFRDPQALRTFLAANGSAVPNVPQADAKLHVGNQINVTDAVEALLKRDGRTVPLASARVAIEQRREIGTFGGVFVSDTDSSDIDLAGPDNAQTGQPTGNDQFAWITIAPDWEGVSASARFALIVSGHGKARVLAKTRWARVLPDTILSAAGLPAHASSKRTIQLKYQVQDRGQTKLIPFSITFGPSNGTTQSAPPPIVAAVTTGSQLRVTYDLTNVRSVSAPSLIVSEPGRVNPSTGWFFRPVVTVALTQHKGTVSVPIAHLQGDGIYGIAIGLRQDPSGGTDVSDFAYTHVLTALHDQHPPAPLLSDATTPPGHMLEIPYGGSFAVTWNVGGIPGATGAMLEISAPGPTAVNSYDPFNNPGGSIRDDNGVDTGSVSFRRVSGTRGTITLKGKGTGLVPTMNEVVRVIPMAGSTPAGEGSDVSTIEMDGIAPTNGGILENGYGINATGSDGFLTSAQVTADGNYLSEVQTFDQKTGAVTATPFSSSQDGFSTIGWGVWGGDIGLVNAVNLSVGGDPPSANTYTLMDPVARGVAGSTWSPPVLSDGVSQIVQAAVNSKNDTAFVLSGIGIGSEAIPYQVFTSNLKTGTFGPTYNVSAALPPSGLPFALGLAQDTGTHTGIVAFASFSGSGCGAPLLASVVLSNGHISLFNGPGGGFPLDIAIDSATHKAVYQDQCDDGLNVIDLTDHTSVSTPLPGVSGLYNAVDPKHGLIAVEMPTGNDGGNNNAMSPIYIYNEQGRLVKTIEQFNFFGTGLVVNASNLQLNPGRRTGYMFGPSAFQLEPFSY